MGTVSSPANRTPRSGSSWMNKAALSPVGGTLENGMSPGASPFFRVWANNHLMPSQWDDAMVSAWMTSCMPLIASEYILAFRSNAINGELLLELSETDLLGLYIAISDFLLAFTPDHESGATPDVSHLSATATKQQQSSG